MTAPRLVRRGATGQLHACVEARGQLVLACGRKLPAGATVWKSRRMIAALWNADDARRCLDCSRRIGAAARHAGRAQIR